MRRSGRSILGQALLMGAIALAALPAAGVAGGPDDPEILSTVSQDPRTITNDADPDPFVTLHLPTGRWVAWAVVRLGVVDDVIATRVDCWTILRTRPEPDRHTVRLMADGTLDGPGEVQHSVAMSVGANVTDAHGATVAVRCRAYGAPSTLVVLREIRIIAMRAGRLTLITPSGSVSWGSGAPHIFQLRQDPPIAVPKSDTVKKLVSLDLPAGRWWIRATLSVQSYKAALPRPNFANWRCRLELGGAADRARGYVIDKGLEDDRQVFTLEVAARVTQPTDARLSCGRSKSIVDPRVRDLRITVIPAGRLTVGDLAPEGVSTTTGNGAPRVIHGRLAHHDPRARAIRYGKVASLPLPKGTWLMTAKYDTRFYHEAAAAGDEEFYQGPACRIRLDEEVGQATSFTRAGGYGVPLQQIGTVAGSRGTVWLECETRTLHDIRMTAIRIHDEGATSGGGDAVEVVVARFMTCPTCMVRGPAPVGPRIMDRDANHAG